MIDHKRPQKNTENTINDHASLTFTQPLARNMVQKNAEQERSATKFLTSELCLKPGDH